MHMADSTRALIILYSVADHAVCLCVLFRHFYLAESEALKGLFLDFPPLGSKITCEMEKSERPSTRTFPWTV